MPTYNHLIAELRYNYFTGRIQKCKTISSAFSTLNEDGGYIADIPDLRFCSAFGETPEKALREVPIAKAAWLETARSSGRPIPPPLYHPTIYCLPSTPSPFTG